MQIAIFVYDHMTALDAVGPYEMLSRRARRGDRSWSASSAARSAATPRASPSSPTPASTRSRTPDVLVVPGWSGSKQETPAAPRPVPGLAAGRRPAHDLDHLRRHRCHRPGRRRPPHRPPGNHALAGGRLACRARRPARRRAGRAGRQVRHRRRRVGRHRHGLSRSPPSWPTSRPPRRSSSSWRTTRSRRSTAGRWTRHRPTSSASMRALRAFIVNGAPGHERDAHRSFDI